MAQLSSAFTDSLELVAEQVGDPTPLVYERLFARFPELEALFVGDKTGAARGNMLSMVLETLGDLAEGKAWAANMIRAERVNHDQLEVPAEVFETFFPVIHEVFREAGGSAWTADMETAWSAVLAQAARV